MKIQNDSIYFIHNDYKNNQLNINSVLQNNNLKKK